MATQSKRNYRVQDVPATLDKHSLGVALDSALGLRDNSHVDIMSLAPDPWNPETQIATFSVTGGASVTPLENGEYHLKGQYKSHEPVRVDDHFLGFTPLNGPPLNEGYGLE